MMPAKKYIIILMSTLLFSGCEKFLFERDPVNSPSVNFDYLWQQADEKYSFFTYKKIDWDEVYNTYRAEISDSSSDEELFNAMAGMLNELEDAHVNLFSPFNISRYHKMFLQSPTNFNFDIIERHYLGEDYFITGSIFHQIIERNGIKLGYLYYPSFSGYVSDDDLDYIIDHMEETVGIIFDVRNNGGGAPGNAFRIASRFATKTTHVYNSFLKNGPGHNDFTAANDVFVVPDNKRFSQPVYVLTNRGCYSATNMFTAMVKAIPNCTVIGDTTGGGGGAPIGGELPNGWSYRFSGTKTELPNGFNIENGIPPDYTLWMDTTDFVYGRDNILEYAISALQ